MPGVRRASLGSAALRTNLVTALVCRVERVTPHPDPDATRLVLLALELAPDKGAVLQGFNRHLHPSHWSGSLAQTLASHLALVESLVGHADSVVADWAQEALQLMRQRIEHDRSMDIMREQSFE